jgi:hypothetical protein
MTKKTTKHPFRDIWTSPKHTIRAIVESNPKYFLVFFATVQGLYALISIFGSLRPVPTSFAQNFVFVLVMIVLSPLLGLLYFWINSWILKWIGTWFKGKGTALHLRTVLAWSQYPILFLVLMFVINHIIARLIIAQGHLGAMPLAAIVGHYPMWLFINSVITAVFGIWSLVIFFAGISEIHKFGIGKALLTGIIALVFWWIILSILLTISALFTNLLLAL